jgi:hypothetical protein
MRVMCIQKDRKEDGQPISDPLLKEGHEYNVVGIWEYEYYILAEFPSDIVFGKSLFIPLSSIDETEMVRNKQTEKV